MLTVAAVGPLSGALSVSMAKMSLLSPKETKGDLFATRNSGC